MAAPEIVDKVSVNVGETVTYLVTVKNFGPNTATSVVLNDLLPGTLTLSQANVSQGSYAAGTGVWTVGDIPNGQQATMMLTATVNTTGAITNTASVVYANDPITANNTGTVTINSAQMADLSIRKVPDNLNPSISDKITYTVTVTNHGPNTANSVVVTDLLPSNLTYIQYSATQGSYSNTTGLWNIGSITSGQHVVMLITARVNATGVITNTAAITSSSVPDPVSANNSSTALVNGFETVDMQVIKTASNYAPRVGDVVVYTVTVMNHGPSPATNVTVNEPIPASLRLIQANPSKGTYNSTTGIWTVGNLPAGQSVVMYLVTQVRTRGTILNTASVSSTQTDSDNGNNSGGTTIDDPESADLSVMKTVDNLTPRQGETVNFTVTVRNYGPDDAAGVTVTDLLPSTDFAILQSNATQGTYNTTTGVWTVGNVPLGQLAVLQVAAQVRTTGTLTNTATVTGTYPDPQADNNTSIARVNASNAADLAVYKTVDKLTPNTGETIIYTVRVTNNGPNNATAVTLTDAIPVGLTLQTSSATRGSYAAGIWTIGDIPVGQTETLQIAARVDQAGAIANTALLIYANDPITANNTSTATINAATAADLSIAKTVDTAIAKVDDVVNFTVLVTNHGPNTATTVSVVDTLPAGLQLVQGNVTTGTLTGTTWAIPSLSAGQTATLSLAARVLTAGSHTNIAQVSAATTDPQSANNSSSSTVTTSLNADVGIAKTVNNLTPRVGENVTWTITVTNYGPNNATGVVATESLPAGLTLVQSSATQGSYNTGTNQWTIGNLPAGQSAVLQLATTVVQTGALTNNISVTRNETDNNAANNSSSATINASNAADLTVAKTANTLLPTAGQQVTFSVTVRNNGPNPATNVRVVDTVPAGMTLVQTSATQGSYSTGTSQWTIGNMAVGDMAILTMVATVNTTTTGAIVNTATVSNTPETDPISANNTSSVTLNAAAQVADLEVRKSVDKLVAVRDELVTFTVTIHNYGPNDAQNVSIADNVPAGIILVNSNASQGSYAANVWTIGTIPVGRSVSLVMLGRVTATTGAISNTAAVISNPLTTTDPVGFNNTSTVTVNASEAADLSIAKTVDKLVANVNDVVTFTIQVANRGPNQANSVTVNDLLNSTSFTFLQSSATKGTYDSNTGIWSVGSMVVGETVTLQLAARVVATGSRTNTATVTSATSDPQLSDNTSSATVNATNASDVVVTKTVDKPRANVGETVTFTVTVTNYGPNTATALTLNEVFSTAALALAQVNVTQGTYNTGSNVWTIGDLATGRSVVMQFTGTIAAAGSVTNTASVTYANDPQAANNSSSATVNATQASDIAVSKTADKLVVNTNEVVTFTVTATNNGPNDATALTITDLLPTATYTILSSSPSLGSYNPTTGAWTIAGLSVGSTAILQIAARVLVTGTIGNTATVTSVTPSDLITANNTASVTLNSSTASDLALTKTVDRLVANVNDVVTFTVTLRNNGPNAATSVNVNDVIPAGFTLVQSSATQGTYAANVWAVGDVPVGTVATLQLAGRVTVAGPISNTASVSHANDPITVNNSSTATVNAAQAADIAVTKAVDKLVVNTNEVVTFTVTARNNGPNDASVVRLTDLLPSANFTIVTASPSVGTYNNGSGLWDVGALTVGQTATLQIAARILTAGALTNTVTRTATTPADPISANDVAMATINAATGADMQIIKTVDKAAPTTGETVTFTVTVRNNGPNTATAVTVTDIFPGTTQLTLLQANVTRGTYNSGALPHLWTLGDMVTGQTETLTLTARVVGSGSIVNTAAVNTTTTDPVSSNNSSSASVNAGNNADISVAKTLDKLTANTSEVVTYTVTVRNNGPAQATGLTVRDLLPTGVQYLNATATQGGYVSGSGDWSIGTLPAGQAVVLQIAARVTSTSGSITNTAIVTALNETDPVSSNNTSTAVLNATQGADIAVTKTVNNVSPQIGDLVTFTVTVQNFGPNTATNLVIRDNVPGGITLVQANPSRGTYAGGLWTIGSLPVGQSVMLTLSGTVTTNGTITNTAQVESVTESDPITANNTSSASLNSIRAADLSVSKTVDNLTPKVGDIISYVVTVHNAGPSVANSVRVQDVLPSTTTLTQASPSQGTFGGSTWNVGTLAVGQTAVMQILATVNTLGGGVNIVTASATETDPQTANNTASAAINAGVQMADLSVQKTVDKLTAVVGETVTYSVVLHNFGPNTATSVNVTDTVPGALTGAVYNVSTGTYDGSNWTITSLPVGQSATLQITGTVNATGTITNTATVSSSIFDPVNANNTSRASVNASRSADVSVRKTVDKLTPIVGETVTFTVIATNHGPNTATNVNVTDSVPVGLTLVNASTTQGTYSGGIWNIGSLPVGQSVVMMLSATVGNTGTINNTATISATETDPQSANNTSIATLNASRSADLSVNKTVDNLNPKVGDTIVYTVTVTNNGPNNATNVSVADNVPSNVTMISQTTSQGTYNGNVWTVNTLPVGQTATLVYATTVQAAGGITNTAVASATETDPVMANNTSVVSLNATNRADLSVRKTVDNITPKTGDNVTFTVMVMNHGPNSASNVTVADALPAGLALVQANTTQGTYAGNTWTIGSLPVGQSVMLTLTATVGNTGQITNQATVSGTETDPVAGNNSSSVSINASRAADVALMKTVDNLAPKTGDNVTYTVRVTNYGPNTATGVMVTDMIPGGVTLVQSNATQGSYVSATGLWTVGSLPVGQSALLTITTTANTTGTITNSSSITAANEPDPQTANNSSSASINVSRGADLAVYKTVDKLTPRTGETVVFTVTVRNFGPNNATTVSVADALPAGLTMTNTTATRGVFAANTWIIGALAVGQSETLQISATVGSTGIITNTAVVSNPTEPDPIPANNTSAATLNASTSADLSVAKTVDNAAPKQGDTVVFAIRVTNNGPNNATGVAVSELLPTGLTLVQSNATQGSYASGTGVWTIGSLPTGQQVTLNLTARVTGTGVLTNTASILSANEPDPQAANNTSSAAVNSSVGADLSVQKTVDKLDPKTGDTVVFTVTLRNNGPNTATGIEVTDLLPAGLTLLQANATTGTYTAGTGRWALSSLPVNQMAILQIAARVDNTGAITNTATITAATETDPVSVNNTSSAGINVSRAADVSVAKMVDKLDPKTGDTVVFSVLVRNDGPNPATTVTVTDVLPVGVTLLQSNTTRGSFVPASGTWSVGTLNVGQSATMQLAVRVENTGTITNTATVVNLAEPDPISANNTSSASINASRAADVAIVKTVDQLVPKTGDVVNFTVTVRNYGPNPATSVSVLDALPAGLTLVQGNVSQGSVVGSTWTVGTLNVGQAAVWQIAARVNNLGQITNLATVNNPSEPDPLTINNTASATINATQGADLSVRKTVDNAAPKQGDTVNFTVTVQNNGPNVASAVTLNDILPAGLTLAQVNTTTGNYAANVWTIGTLPVGQSATMVITATVLTATQITNTASVSNTPETDPVSGNNTSAATINATRAADVSVAKGVDKLDPKTGDTVLFTVTARNHGPNSASAVAVTDVLPAGLTLVQANATQGTFASGTGIWTVGNLPVGQLAVLQLAARVENTGTITNAATIANTPEPDPVAANNTSTAAINASRAADVSIAKAVNNAAPKTGDTVVFAIEVTNYGPNPATAVSVTDAIPSALTLLQANATQGTFTGSTWTVGNLPVGQKVLLQLTASVNQTGTIVNT
ncbi:MAG TPA: DUF11 domain-containing protein, partial [Rhodothermales bacterium]|nr:DUF11 domain-containing protein [Rhodothermales bacterium]